MPGQGCIILPKAVLETTQRTPAPDVGGRSLPGQLSLPGGTGTSERVHPNLQQLQMKSDGGLGFPAL